MNQIAASPLRCPSPAPWCSHPLLPRRHQSQAARGSLGKRAATESRNKSPTDFPEPDPLDKEMGRKAKPWVPLAPPQKGWGGRKVKS